MSFSSWMSELPETLLNLPITQLAIPGSHDSMSFTIKFGAEIAPDCYPLFHFLKKYIGPVARWLCYNWIITQYYTTSEQLLNGIRYFDLRVSKGSSGGFYFIHGLYGAIINQELQNINSYLECFKHEIVLLDFQHIYNFDAPDHIKLIGLLHQIFGSKICNLPPNLTDVTLNWMRAKGYQVILIYRNEIVQNNGYFWPSDRWPTPWPNTLCVKNLFKFLTQTLVNRTNNSGNVSQCILTPNSKYIVKHFFSSLQRSCGNRTFKETIPWLLKQKVQENGGINVVISDFVDQKNDIFPRTVILLNYKSLSQG